MHTSDDLLTLANLARGAAIELFDEAFKKVLENIADPNTAAKAMRGIDLKVKIAPDEDRSFFRALLTCDPKLVGQKPVEFKAYIGREGNKMVAREIKSLRQTLFEDRRRKKGKVNNV